MDSLKSIIETLHGLGIKPAYIFFAINIYFIFQILNIYFTGSININSPIELRRKNKLLFIKEELNSVNDTEIKSLLEEEYKSLIFQEISGIQTTPARRAELIRLYHHTPINLTWPEIKYSIPHLRFSPSGKLIKGMHWIDKAFMSFFLLFSISIMFFSLYISFHFNDFALPKNVLHFLAALLVFFIFFGLAVFAAHPALPVLRAIQIQRWLPLEHLSSETLDTLETPTDDETSSSAPPNQ